MGKKPPLSIPQLADACAHRIWDDMATVEGFNWSDTVATAFIEEALEKAYALGVAEEKAKRKQKA